MQDRKALQVCGSMVLLLPVLTAAGIIRVQQHVYDHDNVYSTSSRPMIAIRYCFSLLLPVTM
jgi:hypothetical protein